MSAMNTDPIPRFSIHPSMATQYGTSAEEYKLWLDYIFDWFGAGLQRRFRRYLVAVGFSVLVCSAGFLIAVPFGLAQLYVTTPGIYIILFGMAWCINALRWLSQIYHVVTNRVRPCFPVSDEMYKKLVSPYAENATRNREIVPRALLVALILWAYLTTVVYGPEQISSVLRLGFPSSFPSAWHTGNNLIPKLGVLFLLSAVCTLLVYTGARITLATLPLYAKLATLPVLPFPGIVIDLFSGVLRVYLTGAAMWSFGILLAEVGWGARLDALGIAFVAFVISLGLLAFFLPRMYIQRIWTKAKDDAIQSALRHVYADPSSISVERISELTDYIQSVIEAADGSLSFGQIFKLFGGQLLPLIPLAVNVLLPGWHFPT